MGVEIRRVVTSAGVDTLLALPHRLHANDPAWVAPLALLERRRAIGAGALEPDGDLVLFLAERQGQPVGSISALRDTGFDAHTGRRVAWFGYLELIDDPEVAKALVDAAMGQARVWGATRLRGPRNLTRFEYMGATVEGHARRPAFLQGHHPAHYASHLEAQGLQPHHDVLAYETSLVDPLGQPVPLPEGLQRKADGCDLPGLVVRSARPFGMGGDLRACHEVLNEAYQTVPDVAPMPLSQWVALGRLFLTIANRRMLSLAFVRGVPVAFAACLPEVNEVLQPMRGRVLPVGWLRAALEARNLSTAGFKLIGVKTHLRGSGLHAVVIRHVIEGCRDAGYTRLEAGVIDERNAPMRAVVEHAGMQVYRRYRIFERSV